MNATSSNRLVQQLIDDIGAIGPAGNFERFGHAFLEGLLGAKLIHRGTTVGGNPVGYTVDTYSNQGTLVAEYSVERDYFGEGLGKPKRDFDHALEWNVAVKRVHLLSSQTAGPKAYGDAVTASAKWDRKGASDVEVTIYDARRIAELIVKDLLVKERAVDGLIEFVPHLQQVQEEFAASIRYRMSCPTISRERQ
jgi:hypothetical protein